MRVGLWAIPSYSRSVGRETARQGSADAKGRTIATESGEDCVQMPFYLLESLVGVLGVSPIPCTSPSTPPSLGSMPGCPFPAVSGIPGPVRRPRAARRLAGSGWTVGAGDKPTP